VHQLRPARGFLALHIKASETGYCAWVESPGELYYTIHVLLGESSIVSTIEINDEQ